MLIPVFEDVGICVRCARRVFWGAVISVIFFMLQYRTYCKTKG